MEEEEEGRGRRGGEEEEEGSVRGACFFLGGVGGGLCRVPGGFRGALSPSRGEGSGTQGCWGWGRDNPWLPWRVNHPS